MQFCIPVNRRVYQKRVKRERGRTNTEFDGAVLKDLTLKMMGEVRGTARAASLDMRRSFYRDRVLGHLMTLK
jgi:hypothetical protein